MLFLSVQSSLQKKPNWKTALKKKNNLLFENTQELKKMTKQQLGTIWSTLVPKGQRVKGQRLDRLSGGAKRLSCSRSRSRGGVSSWSCCCWLFSSSSSLLCNPDNCCRCCSTWMKENLLKTQNVLIAVNSTRVKKWLFYTKISQNHSKQPEKVLNATKKKILYSLRLSQKTSIFG